MDPSDRNAETDTENTKVQSEQAQMQTWAQAEVLVQESAQAIVPVQAQENAQAPAPVQTQATSPVQTTEPNDAVFHLLRSDMPYSRVTTQCQLQLCVLEVLLLCVREIKDAPLEVLWLSAAEFAKCLLPSADGFGLVWLSIIECC